MSSSIGFEEHDCQVDWESIGLVSPKHDYPFSVPQSLTSRRRRQSGVWLINANLSDFDRVYTLSVFSTSIHFMRSG